MDECYRCGFWDGDYGACTCPSSDHWYACPIDNKKPENIKALAEYAEWVGENHEYDNAQNGASEKDSKNES